MNPPESKIISREKIQEILLRIPRPLVFTNGCFDILHRGHVSYLSRARELGSFLWVGVNSDSSVKKLKGEERPLNSEFDRALILSSLFFVDAVTIFTEENPISILETIRPDIHVKGGDYIAEKIIEYQTVIKNGGRVEILPFIPGKSTTGLIEKIKRL